MIRKPLVRVLKRLIDNGTSSQWQLLFQKHHVADIADAVSQLSLSKKKLFFKHVKSPSRIMVFELLDTADQIAIIQVLKTTNAAQFLAAMDKDDSADLVGALLDTDANHAHSILSKMPPVDQQALKQLLMYPNGSAGALMTTDMITIPERLTVGEALAVYRGQAPKESDAAFYLFVVNDDQVIKGVVTLRKLVLANPGQLVKHVRNNYPIMVHVTADQEDVADLFQKYRSIVLPVVDDAHHILGVITIDDVVDVVVEEASEDILKMAGATSYEANHERLMQGTFFYSLRHRLPWLIVTVMGGVMASRLMIAFSPYVTNLGVTLSVILSFVPLLMGLSGNVGNQSAAIVVRALGLTSATLRQRYQYIGRECVLGVGFGGVLAMGVSGYVYVAGYPVIALAIGISVVLNMIIATFLGSALPVVLDYLRIDPAIASAPFISTSLDSIGQVVYFLSIIGVTTWL